MKPKKTSNQLPSIKDLAIVDLHRIYIKNLANSGKHRWHYLFFIRKGKGKIQIDLKNWTIGPSTVILLERFKRWRWIEVQFIDGYLIRFTESFYNFIYTGNPVIKSDQSLAGNIPSIIKLVPDQKTQWEALIRVIENETGQNDENVAEISCLLLKALVVMYNRNTSAGQQFYVYRGKEQILNNFMEILNNLNKDLLTPADFARVLNITPNYLNSICRKFLNKTASQLIEERIILEAKRMLAHTELSISQIAFHLGFKDNSYFTRYFKRVAGYLPKDMRQLKSS